jgi:hypothetical protein
MPILGSSASQSGRVPGQPTSVSATVDNAQSVVSFTAPAYTGKGTVSYTVTSSPGGFTASGASSPITVTGLSNGTSYTFTVTATNAGLAGNASSASASVTPAAPEVPYALSQTFNSSGTYTIPAGKTKIAVFIAGGGERGSNGGGSDGNSYTSGAGGRGGDGGAMYAVKDYPVTAGAVHTVTVGAARVQNPSVGNANSGFSGITTFNNTNASHTFNANSYLVSSAFPSGGAGGGSVTGGNETASAGNPGGNGGGGSLSMTLASLGTVNFVSGGGGGGGGSGGYSAGPNNTRSGGAGGLSGAGGTSGGIGGSARGNVGTANSGNPAFNANVMGGGGGGGAGGGFTPGMGSSGGSTGNGLAGQVVVYVQ